MTTLFTETTFIQAMTLDTSAVYFYSAEEGYIIKVESVEWETYPGNTTLDTCPNNGGKRIFPGKKDPADTEPSLRRRVQAKAKISPAMEGVPIYFRIFDPDDPSINAAPIDTNGWVGGDNDVAGSAMIGGWPSTTDASGEASVIVSLSSRQPGDNFIMLADCCADRLSSVTQAQVDSSSFNPSITSSEMLTIWRRLWVERDSMGPIPESEKWTKGFVNKSTAEIKADSFGRQYSKFKGTMLVPYSGSSPSEDEFEGGNLYFKIFTAPGTYYRMGVSDGVPFRITRSKHVFGCKYEIWPALTEAQLSTIQNAPYSVHFEAQDDGDYSMFDSPVMLDMDSLADAFREAYIEPVYADEFNTMKIPPFKREITLLEMYTYLVATRDLVSSPDLWATHVVACFEGHVAGFLSTEMDPDGSINSDLNGGFPPYTGSESTMTSLNMLPLYGLSATVWNSSAIYMETIRDAQTSINSGALYPVTPAHVMCHEMGHTAGAFWPHENSSSNLMHHDPDVFSATTKYSPLTIRFMRSVNKW
jgi:hypothetical protein